MTAPQLRCMRTRSAMSASRRLLPSPVRKYRSFPDRLANGSNRWTVSKNSNLRVRRLVHPFAKEYRNKQSPLPDSRFGRGRFRVRLASEEVCPAVPVNNRLCGVSDCLSVLLGGLGGAMPEIPQSRPDRRAGWIQGARRRPALRRLLYVPSRGRVRRDRVFELRSVELRFWSIRSFVDHARDPTS